MRCDADVVMSGSESRVYLDYNATTPMSDGVKNCIVQSLKDWGNPSSSHPKGVDAKLRLMGYRADALSALCSSPEDYELAFTSGGTEANNWVIHSCVTGWNKESRPHVVTSSLEHDSIRCCLEHYERSGRIDVAYVPVDRRTMAVTAESVISAVTPNTCLVSVMLANNETGAIQPIRDIADGIHRLNSLRRVGEKKLPFHSDIAQAIGKIPLDLRELGVDLATVVGHKFYGPRIGGLIWRNSGTNAVPLLPMLHGGGQELGLRPGTENIPMIAGLSRAIVDATTEVESSKIELARRRDLLKSLLEDGLSGDVIVNQPQEQLPNTLSVSFPNIACTGSALLEKCRSFFASTGSACHSGSLSASKVLLSSGYLEHNALRTLRLSVGLPTTDDELRDAAKEICAVVRHSRLPCD